MILKSASSCLRSVIITLLFTSLLASAQDKAELKTIPEELRVGFESISESDSMAHIAFLAADVMGGRDTASPGMQLARNYAAALFKIWNIAPAGDNSGNDRSYEQKFEVVHLESGSESFLNVEIGSTSWHFSSEVDFFPGKLFLAPISIKSQCVIAGYGISIQELGYDDFAGITVKDKVVILIGGLPDGKLKDTIDSNPDLTTRFSRIQHFRTLRADLQKKGAAALLFVDTSGGKDPFFSKYFGPIFESKYKRGNEIIHPFRIFDLPEYEKQLPVFGITSKVADTLLSSQNTSISVIKKEIDASASPRSIEPNEALIQIHMDVKETSRQAANLLGIIEGSDPTLREEMVMICAHLDHVGVNDDGYVFRGADDNASGSAAVLEIAQALALNPLKPKRSILFALWTGEEKRSLGSRYFVKYPSVHLGNIVTCINFDMIGRDWTPDGLQRALQLHVPNEYAKEIRDLPLTPDVARSMIITCYSPQCPQLDEIVLQLNKAYFGVPFFDVPNHAMFGSDHYLFHLKKIPSFAFVSPFHKDYHQPTDTIDKINSTRVKMSAQLVYLLASEIANMPERPVWKE